MGRRSEFRALGICGGSPEALCEYRVNSRVVSAKGRYVLAPNDMLEIYNAGGGGYGPPEQRSLESITSDICEGYLSIAAAENDHPQYQQGAATLSKSK